MRFFFEKKQPGAEGDRRLVRVGFERKLSTYHFPAELIEAVFSMMEGFHLVHKTDVFDAQDQEQHRVRIELFVEEDFDEKPLIIDVETRVRTIAQMEVNRQLQAQRIHEAAERSTQIRRLAKKGGGNAHDRRKRLRALYRCSMQAADVAKNRGQQQALRWLAQQASLLRRGGC